MSAVCASSFTVRAAAPARNTRKAAAPKATTAIAPKFVGRHFLPLSFCKQWSKLLAS